MERWQRRTTDVLSNLQNAEFHDALDFALAYFIWSHSLLEWLVKDDVVSKNKLDTCLEANKDWKTYWPIVRDLANRSRHMVIDRDPKDADWFVLREYDVFAVHVEGRERHHMVLFHDKQKYRLLDVVTASGAMWRHVLSDLGLSVDPVP